MSRERDVKRKRWQDKEEPLEKAVVGMVDSACGDAVDFDLMWVKNAINHPWLGMVNIPPIYSWWWLGDGANGIVLPHWSGINRYWPLLIAINHYYNHYISHYYWHCFTHMKKMTAMTITKKVGVSLCTFCHIALGLSPWGAARPSWAAKNWTCELQLLGMATCEK